MGTVTKNRLAELVANATTLQESGQFLVSTTIDPMWRNVPGSTIAVAATVYNKEGKVYLRMKGSTEETYINPGGFYDSIQKTSYNHEEVIETSVMSREPVEGLTVEKIYEIAKIFDNDPEEHYKSILACVRNRAKGEGPTQTLVLAEEID